MNEPQTFDAWLEDLLNRNTNEREALGRKAKQLLEDPLILRLLSVLEGRALRDFVNTSPDLSQPGMLEERWRAYHHARSLRKQLESLAQQLKIDAPTKRT